MNDKMRQRLKKIRLDEGRTQEEQAEFLGVSYEYYKRIESGTRAVSIGFIESITKDSKVDSDFIITGEIRDISEAEFVIRNSDSRFRLSIYRLFLFELNEMMHYENKEKNQPDKHRLLSRMMHFLDYEAEDTDYIFRVIRDYKSLNVCDMARLLDMDKRKYELFEKGSAKLGLGAIIRLREEFDVFPSLVFERNPFGCSYVTGIFNSLDYDDKNIIIKDIKELIKYLHKQDRRGYGRYLQNRSAYPKYND